MTIQYIDTPPSLRRTPGDARYDFVAMQRALDEDDKLARRRSTGPIDWSAATRIRWIVSSDLRRIVEWPERCFVPMLFERVVPFVDVRGREQVHVVFGE